MKTTKILFAAGLFIAFAFFVALFLAVVLKIQPLSTPSLFNSSDPLNVNGTGGAAYSLQVALTAQEVAKHNKASDCWMIINSKVYDLTSLVYSHSGGSPDILKDCGKDGSSGFNSPHGQGGHSSNAASILEGFYIGNIGQQIGAADLQNKTAVIANTTVQRSGEDDEEYEYD